MIDIAQIVATAGAIAGAGAAGYKYVYCPTRRWFQNLNRAIAELRPNCGGSMKDILNQLAHRVEIQCARIVAMREASTIATFECDLSGKSTFHNRALCELFGLSNEEMCHNGWLEAVDPAHRERVYDEWYSAVEKHLPYEAEYTIVNVRNGKHINATAYARPMKSSNGQIIGYFGTVIPKPEAGGLVRT